MRFDHVDFALDSKIIVDAFNHPRLDIPNFGFIISACISLSLFSSKLTNSKVEFNKRQTNEIVHVLVGIVTLLTSLTTYSIVPHCIEHLIINEMIYSCFIKKKKKKTHLYDK